MINIQRDSAQPVSQAFPAPTPAKERHVASGDKFTGLSCRKVLRATVLALAAFGNSASARDLRAPWTDNGIKPLRHHTSGGRRAWANNLPVAPRGQAAGTLAWANSLPVAPRGQSVGPLMWSESLPVAPPSTA